MRKWLAGVSLAALALAGPARADYGWPLAPFARQHAVRGQFGDPRTIFRGPPTLRTIMRSPGSFSFHTGIDIPAAGGTPVYPVASGVVSIPSGSRVTLDAGGGVEYQYWHVRPAVLSGQQVTQDETVLGYVLPKQGHLHFAERDAGDFVNPLAAGHLQPYVDSTVPRVTSIEFRNPQTDAPLTPILVRGRVELVAAASDMPALSVAGIWANMPVSPALVTWRIQRWTGQVVIPERVAADFRGALPPNAGFWSVYARGTYQNMAAFTHVLAFRQPGVYVFELTPTSFDTRVLGNDDYDLIVTATDIRGNHGSSTQRFRVANPSA